MNTQCDTSVDESDDNRRAGFLPLALPSLAVIRPHAAGDEDKLTIELLALAREFGLADAVAVLRHACGKSQS